MSKVITLLCERAVNLDDQTGASGQLKDMPDVHVLKFPCSGMIQPLMVEAALKAGADGVIVCGCQLGDCYYREGNRMIRERLLGERPPGLKKTVDRRRVVGLWLARPQASRFLSAAKEFVAQVKQLPPAAAEAPKAQAPKAPEAGKQATPAAKPAEQASTQESKAKPESATSKPETSAAEASPAKPQSESVTTKKSDASESSPRKEDESKEGKPGE